MRNASRLTPTEISRLFAGAQIEENDREGEPQFVYIPEQSERFRVLFNIRYSPHKRQIFFIDLSVESNTNEAVYFRSQSTVLPAPSKFPAIGEGEWYHKLDEFLRSIASVGISLDKHCFHLED